MEYQTHTFPNGIRLIHKSVVAQTAHFGLLINAGSRDETAAEQGMAHFIEHTIFKGTKTKNAYQIISCLEDVGGDIDAYTTKEETFVYATFLKNYYELAVNLISDICFNATYPKNEINKERLVVLDEINSYKDSPAELIFDDFDELVYSNHPLGKNILGKPSTLKTFKKNSILTFVKNNYFTNEMVFSSVGNIKFQDLVKILEKYINCIPENSRKLQRSICPVYKPKTKSVKKNTFQAHCLMGNIAYDVYDKRRSGLILLNNILAGNSMNSRLNLVLREKYGFAYNVESSFNPFIDTGLLSIYFGTDKSNLGKCIELTHAEIRKLCNKKLSALQLEKAKKQLIGQVTISSENNANLMITLAKSYSLYNKVESLKEFFKKIEKLTPSDLLNISNEILNIPKFTTLTYI